MTAHQELLHHLDRFGQGAVLCVGDVMLDRFIYGTVERISPEAPIPVLNIETTNTMLGGAGNVVRNLLSLGATTALVTALGDDKTGQRLMRLLGEETALTPHIAIETGRTSTQKTRYIAASQQLLRADHETRTPLRPSTRDQLLHYAGGEIPRHGVLLLSDYGKGVLAHGVARDLIAQAAAAGKPAIIDPKSLDFGEYAGAFLLSPNLSELARASGNAASQQETLIPAAREMMAAHHIANMLVTQGKEGMTLIESTGEATHIPAAARDIFDVSGAGDTVVATLGAALAAGIPLKDAVYLANLAAGIVVGKLGTATIHYNDLRAALFQSEPFFASSHKIMPAGMAAIRAAEWRQDGLSVGFTNGCFDLLHPGHLSLLHEAKSRCDRLIVGINSDASVKRLKGPNRPVNAEHERAAILAALTAVDLVVIFAEDTPMALIEALRPDFLLKGADYSREQVVGGDLVESYGGRVVLIPLKEGYSTTRIVARMA